MFLLARDRLKARWPAVALSSIILLHPTYQFLVWEYFHPDALAVAPVLFAYWAATCQAVEVVRGGGGAGRRLQGGRGPGDHR